MAVDHAGVQTVLFDKRLWSVPQALRWLRENKFPPAKLWESRTMWRFRIGAASLGRPFRTRTLGEGVKLVFRRPDKKKESK